MVPAAVLAAAGRVGEEETGQAGEVERWGWPRGGGERQVLVRARTHGWLGEECAVVI